MKLFQYCIMLTVSILLLSSCYSQRQMDEATKKADALQSANADCKNKLSETEAKNLSLTKEAKELSEQNKSLVKRNSDLTDDTLSMGRNYRRLKIANNDLTKSLEKQVAVNKQLTAESEQKNKKLYNELLTLQKELEDKETKLNERDNNLGLLENEIVAREKKVQELQRLIGQKDSTMKALHETIGNALLNFKNKGISVEVKGDKVYVSLEEQILFASGKYKLESKGKSALLELAKVLNDNPNISIMVEGHTDNAQVKQGTACISDNYDLSVLRATEITRILVNDGKVDPKRIIAAGRGEYQPIADNTTAEGKKKNRRTEIILTPNLDKLFKVLND